MSRYTGSIYRRSRRYGFSILENNKEFSKGKKRVTPPGQHGKKRAAKPTNYGEQLIEKQKMKYLYGLNDRQFRRFFRIAQKMDGILTMNLFRVLESRLDNIVYRTGVVPTRRGARQLVNHGHVLIDGKVVSIASSIIPVGSKITFKDKVKKIPMVQSCLEHKPFSAPFLEVNFKTLEATYVRFPERSELPQEINESYVVEWYKRIS